MKNAKDQNETEINIQLNNLMDVNTEYTNIAQTKEEYEYKLISNAILEFESELKDGEEPIGYTLEEFMKMVKKTVWNID